MLLVQGDVHLVRIKAIPSGAKKLSRGQFGSVLAKGEATGHLHHIPAKYDTELFELEKVLYLKVNEPSCLEHTKQGTFDPSVNHGSIQLDPGLYQTGIANETDPFTEEVRKVSD